MQTLEAIAKRKSTRDFDPNHAVPDEVVDTIVKAGCQAPIGGNQRESLHLTVCRSKDILDEINQTTAAAMKMEKRDFFYGAPVVVFVSAAPKQMAPSVEYANAACVIENMLIAATDAGVDNIYLWGAVQGLAKNAALCAKLGIPEGFRPVSAAALGYSLSGAPQPRELSVSLSVNYI
ncbi:MAG: nitroreductase family protein [Clostridiales bacterium]|nr:nitroreductase family protein [Clostridiales bacterium]MCD8366662.1 nitroreductase family protein [Clostridiales bacterium]